MSHKLYSGGPNQHKMIEFKYYEPELGCSAMVIGLPFSLAVNHEKQQPSLKTIGLSYSWIYINKSVFTKLVAISICQYHLSKLRSQIPILQNPTNGSQTWPLISYSHSCSTLVRTRKPTAKSINHCLDCARFEFYMSRSGVLRIVATHEMKIDFLFPKKQSGVSWIQILQNPVHGFQVQSLVFDSH